MRVWKGVINPGRRPLFVTGLLLVIGTAGVIVGGWYASGAGSLDRGSIVLVGAGSVVVLAQGVCFGWLLRRFRAHAAIASALRDYRSGERETAALRVCGEWGGECEAWNDLVGRVAGVSEQGPSSLGEDGRAGAGEAIHEGGVCDALWFGIMLVDREGEVRYANGAAGALLNVDAAALAGNPLGRLVPDAGLEESVRSVVDGQILARRSVEVTCSDEDRRGILRLVLRALPGTETGLVVLEDVTQQRAADDARNAFVAQASHELRAPLTNMRLYLETLSGPECDPKTRAQSMNVVMQELKRLERIVSDMLSVAEIESGALSMHLNDVKLRELLASLREEFVRQAEEKGIVLEIDVPPKVSTIQGDRDKLALTLHNLVNNALKYTEPGGRVTVSVRERHDQLEVEVTDTGIGIDESDLLHVFERFYRARDDRLAGVTGSGLGLSIAREIVRRHGGELEVESQLDHGSTFRLSLPMTKMAA